MAGALNLYTVVAMSPGSRKSAVFAAMTAPLLDAERALAEQTRPAIIEAELARKVSRRDAERHANAAADTSNPQARTQALANATGATRAAENTFVPALPRLVADDVTSEAAASLLAEQSGRLAVLSAEGGIFTTMSGRYSGGVPSLEVFLKGHAGDLLRVDHKSRPAEHVPAPALTLGLALQPEVLRDIARLPGFRGRGLLARILYSLPENTVGRRRIGAAAVPAAAHTYHRELRGLVLALAGDGDRRCCGSRPRRTNGCSTWNVASNRASRRRPTSATSATGPPNSPAPQPASQPCSTPRERCEPVGPNRSQPPTSTRAPGSGTTSWPTPSPCSTP